MGAININHTFKNNRIKFLNTTIVSNLSMYSMEDCIFDSPLLKGVTLKIYKIKGFRFNNHTINIQIRNNSTLSEKVSVDICEFNYSILINHIFSTKDRELSVTKSKLVDTFVKVGNINTNLEMLLLLY